ncbi:hypothetical protein MK852_21690 [Shewanella benthica]|nr:hypothetical protein [Shewanella benthica]MCL1064735.1 hypothetical protein [Shewanella benthica]
MIRRLIATDLKIEMLRPLLSDSDVTDKWNDSYGAHGLELLRMTLYFDLIREMSAISLDRSSKAPSISNILDLLQSTELLDELQKDYCKPSPISWVGDIDEDSKKFWEEKHEERDRKESEERFKSHHKKSKKLFKELKNSDIFTKIKRSRNKLIAHYEMCNSDDGARMFEPADFDLKWGDPEEYYNKIKPIIVELVLLTSNEGYSLDTNNSQHKTISGEFWQA